MNWKTHSEARMTSLRRELDSYEEEKREYRKGQNTLDEKRLKQMEHSIKKRVKFILSFLKSGTGDRDEILFFEQLVADSGDLLAIIETASAGDLTTISERMRYIVGTIARGGFSHYREDARLVLLVSEFTAKIRELLLRNLSETQNFLERQSMRFKEIGDQIDELNEEDIHTLDRRRSLLEAISGESESLLKRFSELEFIKNIGNEWDTLDAIEILRLNQAQSNIRIQIDTQKDRLTLYTRKFKHIQILDEQIRSHRTKQAQKAQRTLDSRQYAMAYYELINNKNLSSMDKGNFQETLEGFLKLEVDVRELLMSENSEIVHFSYHDVNNLLKKLRSDGRVGGLTVGIRYPRSIGDRLSDARYEE